MQVRLAVHGYATGVDGYWGPVTDGKVRTFQTMQGLTVDGLINVPGQTWDALSEKPAHPDRAPGLPGWLRGRAAAGPERPAATPLERRRRSTRCQRHQPHAGRHPGVAAANGLEVDGVCGQQTWSAIDQAAAAKGYTVA